MAGHDTAPVLGDPILLGRLAANLVDNAVRFNVPDGELLVQTHTVDGTALLVVANSGPTIAPDDVPGLFQPFRRLHDRTTHGFGLGLALVASIAGIHGGSTAAIGPPSGGLRRREPRRTARPARPWLRPTSCGHGGRCGDRAIREMTLASTAPR